MSEKILRVRGSEEKIQHKMKKKPGMAWHIGLPIYWLSQYILALIEISVIGIGKSQDNKISAFYFTLIAKRTTFIPL